MYTPGKRRTRRATGIDNSGVTERGLRATSGRKRGSRCEVHARPGNSFHYTVSQRGINFAGEIFAMSGSEIGIMKFLSRYLRYEKKNFNRGNAREMKSPDGSRQITKC